MKHIYEKPQVSVSVFSSEDIMTLSTATANFVDDVAIDNVGQNSKLSWTNILKN